MNASVRTLRFSRRAAALVVALLVAAVAVVVVRSDDRATVSAVFPRTVGLYEGSEVRVMGLEVGEVTRITPRGTSVRVDMAYDAAVRLPADVGAVVVAPSVIADRFVQLTPAWDGGPVLAEGAVIDPSRTAVPVELDETFSATKDLVDALGPDGANRDGAVADLLGVVAETLDGQGAAMREAIAGVADVAEVLGEHGDDVAGTVDHLAGFTGELARYDRQVEQLNTRLGSVAGVLADEQDGISALLASLASTLGEVEGFVAEHRTALTDDVASLAAVASALDAERTALRQVVDIAPLAFTNLVNTYDPETQAVRTRANFGEILRGVDKVLCNALQTQAGEAVLPACDLLSSIVDQLPLRGGLDLDGSSDRPPLPVGDVAAPTVAGLPDLLAGLRGGVR